MNAVTCRKRQCPVALKPIAKRADASHSPAFARLLFIHHGVCAVSLRMPRCLHRRHAVREDLVILAEHFTEIGLGR